MTDWIGLLFFVLLVVGIFVGLKMLSRPEKRTEADFESKRSGKRLDARRGNGRAPGDFRSDRGKGERSENADERRALYEKEA